jgi:prepilin-type N-terminal cleavage/methylation domain-containing protein
MKNSSQSGFSLIEITIVLGLIGVIAAFGVAMSFSSLSNTSVTQERDLFVTLLLRGTRSAAIANMGEVAHGVQIDNANHRYILFTGTTYNSSDPNNRSIPYTNDAITVGSTGGDTIVFEQLSGKVTTGAGTISIGNGSATQEITIRNSGQIDWQV